MLIILQFDSKDKARPLKRAIQKQIADPLAQRILGSEFKEGDHIELDANSEGVLSFHKADEHQPVTA